MPEKQEPPILAFESQDDWEEWLEKNHSLSGGVWLKFFKKHSGKKTILYKEALDVALCHGWIDSQIKKFDDTAYLQKFSPRGPKSVWSQINREHVARLEKAGKMKAVGRAKVEAAKKDGRWDAAYASPANVTMAEDFKAALARNEKARAFYETLNKANTYGILTRIQFAKKPETRQKKIKEFIDMLARGQKLH
jgi:uncharacterized protein YdeI (YjbR/CyaY-like superfamily)